MVCNCLWCFLEYMEPSIQPGMVWTSPTMPHRISSSSRASRRRAKAQKRADEPSPALNDHLGLLDTWKKLKSFPFPIGNKIHLKQIQDHRGKSLKLGMLGFGWTGQRPKNWGVWGKKVLSSVLDSVYVAWINSSCVCGMENGSCFLNQRHWQVSMRKSLNVTKYILHVSNSFGHACHIKHVGLVVVSCWLCFSLVSRALWSQGSFTSSVCAFPMSICTVYLFSFALQAEAEKTSEDCCKDWGVGPVKSWMLRP